MTLSFLIFYLKISQFYFLWNLIVLVLFLRNDIIFMIFMKSVYC